MISFYKINIFVQYNVTEHHDSFLDTRCKEQFVETVP